MTQDNTICCPGDGANITHSDECCADGKISSDKSSCYTCEDTMVLNNGTCCVEGEEQPNVDKTKCCKIEKLLTAGDRAGKCCEGDSEPSADGTLCENCPDDIAVLDNGTCCQ